MSTTLIVVASASPAAILGALALWLPAKWARDDAADYRSEAERTFDAATSLADEVERTRNLPWYWPTDPDVTGEVLAVEPGHTYVVGENGPVLALSDRPAEDEDEVGDEQPGEAASSIPSRLKAWATDVLDRVHDWLPNLVQQWRERNDVGSGEQATADDPFERFRIDDSPRGRCQPRTDAEIRAELAELTAEPEPVRIEHRYRPAGETGQFPYVKVAGAPRHAAPEPEPEMPAINATIPAPRDGGDN